jgi:ubiquinone/menaquinone biosynthesis C-methylase UbiE
MSEPGEDTAPDLDEQRAAMLDNWESVSAGWGKQADRTRRWGMPVSSWLIEHAELQPGQDVVELAAGPGDTGFLAAELIRPGGTLISSDGTDGMVAVARERAQELGVENVEFKQLQLEWIDLETASADVVLCRWGLMFAFDPGAALQEMRRVLRPGGRIAFAVWDAPKLNPWATIPNAALIDQGLVEAPDPNAPGIFALSRADELSEMVRDAGFVDVDVESIEVERRYVDAEEFVRETLDLSSNLARAVDGIAQRSRAALEQDLTGRLQPFRAADGTLRLPGRSLGVAAAA